MSDFPPNPPSAPFPNKLRATFRRRVVLHARAVQLAVLGAEAPVLEEDPAVHLMNLAFALRNLLRIAEVARDVPGVSEAKAKFEAAIPGIKDARDVLEHFDDYALGVGKLQQRGALREFFTIVERNGTYATLNVAARFTISTEKAFPAAVELGVELLRALAPGRPIAVEPRRAR